MAITIWRVAAIVSGAATMGIPLLASAQSAGAGVTARGPAGHQIIEIDMAALADPAPGRVTFPSSARAVVAEASPASSGTPARKRFPRKVGVYGEAPMAALPGSAN